MPGQQLRHPRGAGRLRRHLAHPSLSRDPLRHRPLHLRLPLQALARRTDRDGGGDQPVPGRGDRGERSRPPHPLPASDRTRGLVERGEPLDHRREADRHGRGGPLHRGVPVDVPGLLPACARATPRAGRAWSCFEGRSSIRRPGPRTWTTAARTSWSSAPAPRRPPSSRPWRRTCGHVTMLQRSPTWYRTARNAIPIADELRELEVDEELDPRDRPPQDPLRDGEVHPPDLHRARQGKRGVAGRRARPARPGLRHRHPLHAALPALAPATGVRSRRRSVPCDRARQGFGRDRRDRDIHANRHPAQVRPAAGGGHHRHRHRLPPQRAGRHRLRGRRRSRWPSTTP